MVKAIYATGRRKDASARVYLTPAEGDEPGMIVINQKVMEEYFPQVTKQMIVRQPLEAVERLGNYNFKILVAGGGFSGQAQACVHGIARALEKVEPELRPTLKKGGFLTRDPRVVERKKPGRHKARKKPQFSKR